MQHEKHGEEQTRPEPFPAEHAGLNLCRKQAAPPNEIRKIRPLRVVQLLRRRYSPRKSKSRAKRASFPNT